MYKTVSSQKIQEFIKIANPKVASENLSLAEDLFEKGDLDSYSSVQLILEFEREYDIVFDFSDLNSINFKTVNSIMKLLTTKYGCKAG